TERQVYQGSTSGTLLKTIFTCYNGSSSPCNLTPITLPITERTVILEWPGTNGLQSMTVTQYNNFGLVVENSEYAYGAGAPGSLVRNKITNYATLGNGIVSMPASITVEDSSSNIKSQITYTYDQGTPTATSGTPQHVAVSGTARGNPTTISSLIQGSTTLSKTFTYYDTGTINVATDVNGATTTNTYGSGSSCGNSFPTLVAEPLSLTRSMTWNCTGGGLTSITDENGKTSSISYTDPYFWRLNSVTDQESYAANFTYNGQTSIEFSLGFNGGASTTDVLATLDSLGRLNTSQLREGPSSTTF